MRHWSFLIVVAICGCSSSQPDLPISATALQERYPGRYPVVAGDVEVTVGDGRMIIAPPGSATAGSRWIEHTVSYTNKSGAPIWIVGYSETHPFSGIETRANETTGWRHYGPYYCGTGAREFAIAPDASYTFTAALPREVRGAGVPRLAPVQH